MRFLVVTKPKYPFPPEMVAGLFDAMAAWVEQNKASGKMEMVWGFAGTGGGGGILNVESLEELDAIMAGFPAGPFSEIEIQPLVEVEGSMARARAAFQAMAGG
jgi:muconolactone delta-isomerase